MNKLKIAAIAAWGLVAFVAFEACIFLPLFLVGLPVAWFAAKHAELGLGVSRMGSRSIIVYKNPILNWWVGNYEDGVIPDAKTKAFRWFVRNPVTNLRFVPLLSTRPDPERLQSVGSDEIAPSGTPCLFLAWQFPYVGFRYQNKSWGVWLGWKLNPRDKRYVDPNDYRRFGIGVAAQILRF